MAINPPKNATTQNEPSSTDIELREYVEELAPSRLLRGIPAHPADSDVFISVSGNVEHGGHSKATAEEVEQSLRGNYQLVDPQCASTNISGTVFKFTAWWQLEDEFTKMHARIESLETLLAKHERALPRYIPEEENPPAKKTTPKKRGRAAKKTSAKK